MKKIYYLGTCDTCAKILHDIGAESKGFSMQDIKTTAITPKQLEEMKKLSGSFESLFSRRALKYKSMKLKDRILDEGDYRDLILQEYTFLKRPVIISGKRIFIGSEKRNVEALLAHIQSQ